MSRAIRRQQSGKRAKRGQQKAAVPRPAARPSQQQKQQAGAGVGVSSMLRPHWATEIISELRKVTWPSREDTWYLTFVVLVVAIVFGVFLGGVDMFFNWFIDNTVIP